MPRQPGGRHERRRMTSGFLFDRVNAEPASDRGPTGVTWDWECPLPVAPSRSPRARHASATGAQYAARDRGELILRYVRLLKDVGPVSDHEAAAMLGRGLSSINSTRAKLGDRVVSAADLDEVHKWPGGYITRRTRWRLQEGTWTR